MCATVYFFMYVFVIMLCTCVYMYMYAYAFFCFCLPECLYLHVCPSGLICSSDLYVSVGMLVYLICLRVSPRVRLFIHRVIFIFEVEIVVDWHGHTFCRTCLLGHPYVQ